MTPQDYIEPYNEAIVDTNRERALRVVHAAVEQGLSSEDVVFEIVLPAMEQMIKAIGNNFDAHRVRPLVMARIADTARIVNSPPRRNDVTRPPLKRSRKLRLRNERIGCHV